MRTYNQSETHLAFQWVDKYFKLVELMLEMSGGEQEDIPLCAPSLEFELKFQKLKRWFFAHENKFIPIWSEFWRDKLPVKYFEDNVGGQEYFTNPFLLLYKPDNLCELAYRLGVSENIDTWEPTEHDAAVVDDISVELSMEVLQFLRYVGEFTEDNSDDKIAD